MNRNIDYYFRILRSDRGDHYFKNFKIRFLIMVNWLFSIIT